MFSRLRSVREVLGDLFLQSVKRDLLDRKTVSVLKPLCCWAAGGVAVGIAVPLMEHFQCFRSTY